MKKRWSLEKLYPSFESEKFKEDFTELNKIINEINEWAKNSLNNHEKKEEKMAKFIELASNFQNKYSLLMTFSRLNQSVDANNKKAAENIEILENKYTEITVSYVKFQKWLGQIDNLKSLIKNTDKNKIKEHEFFIKEMAEKSKYLLSDKEEYIIAKMKNTGSKAWTKLQQKLTSTLMIDFELNGEKTKIPLPELRNKAYSPDPEVRKKAYETELKAYKEIDEPVAQALNGIKGEVLTRIEFKGYDNPLEKTLIDSRMSKETLDSMLEAIKENLDNFHQYFLKKAEMLGHDNALPFYDLFAPIGESKSNYSYEEAADFIINNFRSFDDKLADFVQNAFENNWIDAEPREGKRGGAFCSNIQPISESRILTNFNGSFSNVTTLAHELGHAYHGNCLKDEAILNTSYPMPLAETASIFNETIITKAALEKTDGKEFLAILENSISQAAQVIVDIYSRFLFEKSVFEKRKNSSLNVDELKELMLEAQKKAYGKGLDHENLHPYMWIPKPHYYSGELNYYNFPYAFGLLFGKGVYAQYEDSPEGFREKYDNLLAETGKNSIEDVASMLDIDVQSVDFWKKSLSVIKEDIDKFLNT
ncbi:MAG: M3 family oligoendopeptidase [Bacillota bacterium]